MRRSPAPLLGLRVLALAVLVLLCTPSPALAEQFQKDKTPLTGLGGSAEAAPASSGSGIGRLVLGLAIVAGLVLGLRWLLKRANRSKSPQATGALQIVATTSLAQNRFVHLIRVGNELVLVGSAEQGITPLRVYEAAEARTLETSIGIEPFVDTGSAGVSGLLGDLRRRTAR